MSLISKNKIGFIDGIIEAPTHTSLLFSYIASSVWTMPLTYGSIYRRDSHKET